MTGKSRTSKTRRSRKPPTPSKARTPRSQGSKLDRIAALLARATGATIDEMVDATGWQPHSVRGAIAGSLKRRGLAITSDKVNGVRRYRSDPAK